VVVRSFAEIANLVERLPKNWGDDQSWKYNVMYLRHSIDSEKVLDLLEPKKTSSKWSIVRGLSCGQCG
jgi:hypothetical protein